MSSPSLPSIATYRPTIVWGTGTGIDTSAYDDVSRYYLNTPGLVVDGIGRDQARAYAPPAAPAFDLTLTNWDGRFSPGGPIGGFIGRGSDVHLDVDWGLDPGCNDAAVVSDDPAVLANGIERVRLFEGVTHDIEHTLTRPARMLGVRALGRFASRLLDQKPRTTRLYEGIRTDQAVAVVLDLVGWPADRRVLDTGDTGLTYWWLDGQVTGVEAINQILAAEGAGGCAYEQGGVFHFEGRQSRETNARSTTTQWLFSDGLAPDPNCNGSLTLANDANALANGLPGGAVMLFDVNPSEYRSNPDEVVSAVTMAVNQRSPTAVQRVWELGRPLTVPTGTPLVLEAAASDPFKGAVTPAVGVDYTVTGGAITNVTLLETSGQTVRIQWTAGPAGATVIGGSGGSNGPQLRAVSLPVISHLLVRSTVDTSLQAPRYQAGERQIGGWPEVDRLVALDIVNSMTQRYMQERRQATIRVTNLDAAHLGAILHVRVSDRVTWVQQHGGLNDPYWIEQISHQIAPGGGLHVMTLGLERVFDQVGGRFDSAKFDVDRFGT